MTSMSDEEDLPAIESADRLAPSTRLPLAQKRMKRYAELPELPRHLARVKTEVVQLIRELDSQGSDGENLDLSDLARQIGIEGALPVQVAEWIAQVLFFLHQVDREWQAAPLSKISVDDRATAAIDSLEERVNKWR